MYYENGNKIAIFIWNSDQKNLSNWRISFPRKFTTFYTNLWLQEEEERLRKEEAEKKAKEAEEKKKRLEEAEMKRQAMMQAQKEKQQAAGLVFDFKYCNTQWEIFNDFFHSKIFNFLWF